MCERKVRICIEWGLKLIPAVNRLIVSERLENETQPIAELSAHQGESPSLAANGINLSTPCLILRDVDCVERETYP